MLCSMRTWAKNEMGKNICEVDFSSQDESGKRDPQPISKQPPISLEQGAASSGGELIDSPVSFILSSLQRFL